MVANVLLGLLKSKEPILVMARVPLSKYDYFVCFIILKAKKSIFAVRGLCKN